MGYDNSNNNRNDDCYINYYNDGNNNNRGVPTFSNDRSGGRGSLDDSDNHNERRWSQLSTSVLQGWTRDKCEFAWKKGYVIWNLM